MAQSTKITTPSEVVGERFRLISVVPTSPPSGGLGDGWLMYRIAQGENRITGYRRSSGHSPTAEMEGMVDAFNQRLLPKGQAYRSAARARKASLPSRKDLV